MCSQFCCTSKASQDIIQKKPNPYACKPKPLQFFWISKPNSIWAPFQNFHESTNPSNKTVYPVLILTPFEVLRHDALLFWKCAKRQVGPVKKSNFCCDTLYWNATHLNPFGVASNKPYEVTKRIYRVAKFKPKNKLHFFQEMYGECMTDFCYTPCFKPGILKAQKFVNFTQNLTQNTLSTKFQISSEIVSFH